MTKQVFDPREQPRKASRHPHVKFDLASDSRLETMIVLSGRGPVVLKVEDPQEISAFKDKVHRAADGRIYGIFIPAGRHRVSGGGTRTREDGTVEQIPEKFVMVPDSIAPQRAVLGPNGEQNLDTVWDGQVHRMLVPVTCVKNLELCLVRDDLPSYRAVDENFDPAQGAGV